MINRKNILSEEGLNNFEDAPSKILQYASQKYSRENSAGFGDKMRVLELKHQKSVEAVFKNPDISEDFIYEQFKDSPNVKKVEAPVENLIKEADFKLENEVEAPAPQGGNVVEKEENVNVPVVDEHKIVIEENHVNVEGGQENNVVVEEKVENDIN